MSEVRTINTLKKCCNFNFVPSPTWWQCSWQFLLSQQREDRRRQVQLVSQVSSFLSSGQRLWFPRHCPRFIFFVICLSHNLGSEPCCPNSLENYTATDVDTWAKQHAGCHLYKLTFVKKFTVLFKSFICGLMWFKE